MNLNPFLSLLGGAALLYLSFRLFIAPAPLKKVVAVFFLLTGIMNLILGFSTL